MKLFGQMQFGNALQTDAKLLNYPLKCTRYITVLDKSNVCPNLISVTTALNNFHKKIYFKKI
jgi:hypothetical protein